MDTCGSWSVRDETERECEEEWEGDEEGMMRGRDACDVDEDDARQRDKRGAMRCELAIVAIASEAKAWW